MSNMMNLELKNSANTNGCYWGGKLHALWEAGAPHELDPDTLETKGASDMGGLVGLGPKRDGRAQPVDTGLDAVNDLLGMGASAFTAHPHVDPIRKRLVGWTWTNLPRSDSMRIGE